jgi:hypothetical protein
VKTAGISPVAQVRRWVELLVVGEGLCPFAAKPMREGQVRITASEATDAEGVFRDFLAEVEHLLAVDASVVETTLLATPYALADFAGYLDLLGRMESALEELELESVLQLASFHPDYRFEGEPEDDASHYTNRSPYPVFHLIRQSSIDRALQDWPGDPEEIPRRNQRRMRELGRDYLRRLLIQPKVSS